MLEWARNLGAPPETPDKLASEIIWIVLCAGRRAQAARTIERKVWTAIAEGAPVMGVFRHPGKAAAIEYAWRHRDQLFREYRMVAAAGNVDEIVRWCGDLPFVGADTKWQLAKNCGIDCCKPDIWLCRLAGIPDKPRLPLSLRLAACLALCHYLQAATGDSLAVIDSVLWLACNKGVLKVSPEAGPVAFIPSIPKAGSIFEPA